MKQTKSVLNPPKPTLKMAKEYKDLEAQITFLEARKKALREIFIEHGPCDTRNFSIAIAKYMQDRLAGIKDVTQHFPMKQLMKLGLINKIEIRQVSVSLKKGMI